MSDAPLLFLDANALASPLTRILLIAGAKADGLRWTWDSGVESTRPVDLWRPSGVTPAFETTEGLQTSDAVGAPAGGRQLADHLAAHLSRK